MFFSHFVTEIYVAPTTMGVELLLRALLNFDASEIHIYVLYFKSIGNCTPKRTKNICKTSFSETKIFISLKNTLQN